MSAIVGLLQADGRPVDPGTLDRMLNAVAHRGPDGAGSWRDGAIGFGHQMLWTTRESLAERLPLVNNGGDIVITADARVDNRDELISQLGLGDRDPERIADSELILRAYERWGTDCPEKLLGDFAFAIWDAGRQHLFCARDHFGVKPFYYYSSPALFAFATEIKALLSLEELTPRLNEIKVADFLAELEDHTSTFYCDILRLPPAHTLTLGTEGRISLQQYWTLEIPSVQPVLTDEEYALQLRDLFAESVRQRTRSAFPVGSMLSGGLDSSSITCVARTMVDTDAGGPLHTYSARFDNVTECDERHYQDAVLSQNSVLPHYLIADRLGPLHEWETVLSHQTEAIKGGNHYINYHFFGQAHENGVRVLLDGFDGDSTISHGLGYFPELAQAGRWITLGKELRAYAPHCNESWTKALWGWMWFYGLAPRLAHNRALSPAYRGLRRLTRLVLAGTRASDRISATRLINRDFVRRTELADRIHAQRSSATSERESHLHRLTQPGMVTALETLNRSAAAHNVELRFPFWDKRLIEFCLALPVEQKIHKGWTRIVMRRAMDGVLPEIIRWRGGKSNMHPSFEHGLRTISGCELEKFMVAAPDIIADFVDTELLYDVYKRFVSDTATVPEVNAMWRAVCLGLWLHHAQLSSRMPLQKGGDIDEEGLPLAAVDGVRTG